MDRQEFITKIIKLYPDTFREDRMEHIQSWVEMYEKAIRKDWDMDKLMRFFATEYKSTVVPPPPSFFYSFRSDVAKPKKQETFIKIPAPEEMKDDIAYQNFCEKKKELVKKLRLN